MATITKPPQIIRLTTPDRAFLIPETTDPQGLYFPMSPVCSFTLHRALAPDEVIKALCSVERKFPQFRLAYKLDAARSRLARVPEPLLNDYFASLVQSSAPIMSRADYLALAIRTNNAELSHPIEIVLYGKEFVFKLHHCFGDGKLLFHLTSVILLAIADPAAFENLPPLPMNFGLPLAQIIFQSPAQTAHILGGWLKALPAYVREFQQDTASTTKNSTLTPILSGSQMGVVLKLIAAETMGQIDDLRSKLSEATKVKISLNTLIQVLIGYRLKELGFDRASATYSVPVDLRRYLKTPSTFYPGNFVGQIRIKTMSNQPQDFQAECLDLQQQIDQLLDGYGPMLGAPSECLAALSDSTYKNLNREWFLKSINAEERFFIMSNVGKLDSLFQPLAALVDAAQGLFVAVPLMGDPHLVCSFSSYAGQGNLTITYDPRVLTEAQVNSMCDLFDPAWLSGR